MSSNANVLSTGPKKKRAKKALERKHKEPLPVSLQSLTLSWSQHLVNALYMLIGYQPTVYRVYKGEYSEEGSCVWIRDVTDMQEIFCKGFFGKGNLSRSEPTWSQRIASNNGAKFLENITEARRKQRRSERLTKLTTRSPPPPTSTLPETMHSNVSESTSNHAAEDADISHTTESNGEEEHLQLSLVESFFLAFGLDCLQIVSSDEQTISLMNCWKLFCLNAVKGHNLNNVVAADYQLPYRTIDVPVGLIQFDNPFIINYVAYHYYRSKAWVIKDGLKFGVDYILYRRGPAFHHGEYAVVVIPSYPDGHGNGQHQKSWKSMLGVNRVCAQANKTLLLCYVNLPPPRTTSCMSPACLSKYSVTEVSMKRWIPEKTRA